MKFKKGVIALAVLSLFFTKSVAQIHEVKVLFFQYTMTEFPYVYSDKVTVTKVSNDTTWFSTTSNNPSGKGNYYRAGQRIYRVLSATDTVLYYDYNLLKNDIFIIKRGSISDTFVVDSVYYRRLNHRTFKAWHFTSKGPIFSGVLNWDWLEGLGELKTGWDYKSYPAIDHGWEIKGMCLNDSVIFWDSTYNYFKDRNPSPTCMFDSVSKRLGVQEKVASTNFTFYPNPASDAITIQTTSKGRISIVDITGRIFMAGVPLINGSQTLDVSELRQGIYFIVVQQQNNTLVKKICIVKP